jgi:rubrerythrin
MEQTRALAENVGAFASTAPSASVTNRNLWLAFTEEAKANRLYLAYAMKAMEEGYPEVAEVFLEVSGAETAHALNLLRILGEVGTTRENLKRVIEEEMIEASVMYPRMRAATRSYSRGRRSGSAAAQRTRRPAFRLLCQRRRLQSRRRPTRRCWPRSRARNNASRACGGSARSCSAPRTG